MKQAHLRIFIFTSILILSSCEKESINTIDPDKLENTWFRSYPNKVWGGRNKPPFERGETHVRITFRDNGEFIYNRTVLGLYKGTSIEDTTAIVIESGIYSADEEKMDIILNKRIWWDSFYVGMVDFEESSVNANKYRNVTYKVNDRELNLVYFTWTDVITEEQETPGLQKYDEIYIKE